MAQSRRRGLLYDHAVISGLEVRIGPPAAPWGVLGVYARRPRALRLRRAGLRARGGERDRRRSRGRSPGRTAASDHLRAGAGRATNTPRALADARRDAEQGTRARIMELLHDEALQSLLAVRHDLAVHARRPERPPESVARAMEVQRAIRELRGAIGAAIRSACRRRLDCNPSLRAVAEPRGGRSRAERRRSRSKSEARRGLRTVAGVRRS